MNAASTQPPHPNDDPERLDKAYVESSTSQPAATHLASGDPFPIGEDQLNSLLVDSVEDYAIYLLDPQGTILTWNTGATQLNGYVKEEVLGRSFSLFFPAEEQAAGVPQALLEVAAHSGRAVREGWRQRKDGTRFWAEATIKAVTDAQGALVAFAKVTRDRTERKTHEERIERLNRLYAVLSDINQAIVRTRNLDALFPMACRIAVEKGGFSLAWIARINPATQKLSLVGSAGINADDLEAVSERLAGGPPERSLADTALRSGQPAIVDDILALPPATWWLPFGPRDLYRSGASLPLLVDGAPAGLFTLFAAEPFFFDGEQRRLLAELADDLSFAIEVHRGEQQRKEALQELSESAARYRSLIEHAPDAVFVNVMDRVALVNQACVKLFGAAEPADLVGRPIYELFAPAYFDVIQERVRRLRDDGDPVGAIEEQIVRLDGSLLEVEVTAAPFPYGNTHAIHVMIRDVSHHKRYEVQLLQLNAELEQRVRERTAELEARNRELETFTYSVSHDLKAPLRGIDGYSRLLEEDYGPTLDDEGRRFLATIRRATRQMNQLIEDLLAYSRLERRKLQSIAVNLPALAGAIKALYLDEIERRGIDLQINLPEVTLVVDPEGLSMALRNLIDNALKFTRPIAAPQVAVGARIEGGACTLWVRDNGIGFDMKYHERIFEIFQRLNADDEYAGTGIGLAIVRKAVERMGGHAWAKSDPAEGTTFFLELPYAQGEQL